MAHEQAQHVRDACRKRQRNDSDPGVVWMESAGDAMGPLHLPHAADGGGEGGVSMSRAYASPMP